MKLIKLLFGVGLLHLASSLSAQTDFRSGFIIHLAGDTLYGEIDYRGDLLMSRVCKFKDKKGEITAYDPDDIEAFRFLNSKFFVSREVNNINVFLQYLIKGEINVFYMRDDFGDHYYIEKKELELIEIPYEEGIKYIDNKKIAYQSKRHIGLLYYYMQDAPDFQSRINSIKKPEHKSLINLAEDYHYAVCEGEKCIIYESRVPFIKIIPEILGGVIKYSNVSGLNERYYTQAGLIGHIWIPRTSEKLYFRTGVLFYQLDLNGEQENYYKIPVQLEYIYPKGIIRPRFAYGLNLYLNDPQSVSLDLGANIKLNETMFLSATSDIEFNSRLLIAPKSILSHSMKLGLFLNIK